MRNITDYDLAASAQLKKMYQLKKKSLDLTQNKLAKQLNVSQGYIAQCLNGHTALDLSIILQFAEALQVRPQDVDPNFERRFPQTGSGYNPARMMENLPLAGTFTEPTLELDYSDQLTHRFADSEYCLFRSVGSVTDWAPTGTRFMVATRQRTFIDGAPGILERRSDRKMHYQIVRFNVSDNEVSAENVAHQRGDRYYPIISTQFV